MMTAKAGFGTCGPAVAACALLGACQAAAPAPSAAPAQATASFAAAGAPTPATFTDPTEDAFTMSVPQGWAAQGGVHRTAPSMATVWASATSPDGATTIMINDPSLPSYSTPNNMHPAGSTYQLLPGVTDVSEPYENGQQFAQDWANRRFGQVCTSLTPTASQAEPALAQATQAQSVRLTQMVGAMAPNSQFSGGSMTFTCQSQGATSVIGVIVVTSLSPNAMGASWGVPVLVAYRTPAGSQAQTDQIGRAMQASLQDTAQWDQKMVLATRQTLAAIQQNGAAAMAAQTQLENSESAALQAQGQAEQQALNAQHAAGMQQLNQQGQTEQQNFAQQQYNQETQQQAEMRYIQNQQCVQWADAAQTRCAVTAPN